MRTVAQIQQDITKLQAELEDVKVHEHKHNSAVSILENLGWTHSRKGGWKKPEPKRDYKEFDKDTMSPYKQGDYLYSCGVYYRVADVHGKTVRGQRVLGGGASWLLVLSNTCQYPAKLPDSRSKTRRSPSPL